MVEKKAENSGGYSVASKGECLVFLMVVQSADLMDERKADNSVCLLVGLTAGW